MKKLHSQNTIAITLVMITLSFSSTTYGQRNAKQKPEQGEITDFNLEEEENRVFAFKQADSAEVVTVNNHDKVLAPIPFLQKRVLRKLAKDQRKLYHYRDRHRPEKSSSDVNELSRIVYRNPNRVFGNDKFRHPKGGWAVAFSPDNQYLASGGRDHFVRLFNVQTGTQEKVLVGHQGAITAIGFIPETDLLISIGFDTRVWNYKTGLPLFVSGLRGHTLSVSHNGKHVLIDDKLFEIESTNPFKLNPAGIQLHVGFPRMSYFTEDDQYVVVGSQADGVWAWDVTNRKSAKLGDSGISSVQLSSFAQAFGLPSVDNDETISISRGYHNVLAGDPQFLKQAKNVVSQLSYHHSALAASPNGQYIAGNGDGLGLRVFDFEQDAFCFENETDGRLATLTCSFSRDGNLLATGGSDGVVRIRDVDSGEVVEQWDTGNSIYRVRFAPDQPLLAIGCGNGDIKSWNLATNEQKTIAKKHSRGRIHDMAFHAGTQTLAVTNSLASLTLVNYETGKPITFFNESSNCVTIDPVTGILMFGAGSSGQKNPPPNPRFLDLHSMLKLSGSDNPLQENINFLPQTDAFRLGQLKSMDIAPTKRLLAASDWSGNINIWNLDEKQGIARIRNNFGGVNTIRFIPNTPLLVTGGKGGVVVWNTESRQPTHILNSDSGAVQDLSVFTNENGSIMIATANDNGTIQICDLQNLKK